MVKENTNNEDQVKVPETTREFEFPVGGNVTKLKLRQPTTEELNWGEWEYARIFNSAISEGIRPQSALIASLAENGIKVKDMQDEAIEIMNQVADTEKDLAKARETDDKDEINRIKEDLKELRELLMQKNAVTRDYLRQAAEGKSSDARDSFLMANLIEFADGPKVGKPFYSAVAQDPKQAAKSRYKKYQDDKDFNFKAKLAVEYITFINGLPIDFLESLPENQKEKWEEPDKEVAQEPAAKDTEAKDNTSPADAPETKTKE